MPSDLYQSAVASLLEDERGTLTTLEAWLQDLREVSGAPFRGDRILENLQSEAHLVGDHPWGHFGELAEFLRRCIRDPAGMASDPERHQRYVGACGSYEGKGYRIERDRLPDRLLRYSRSRRTALTLIERILGPQAKRDVNEGRISLDDQLARLSSRWDSTRVEENDQLGRFATFEHPAGAPRDSARGMAEALALPLGPLKDETLLEFSYSKGSVTNYRFPTIADAGWFQEFQPAPEVEPDPTRPETCYGWTRPLGSWPPQPELVHDDTSLRILDRPPRFLGRCNS